MPRIKDINSNLAAFLDMIAFSEGTAGRGDDGYNVIVGGSLFYDYSDHPRKLITLRPGLKSTAAGRYQILMRISDAYCSLLNLNDFSPENQDRIAIRLISEKRGALADIEAGKIKSAISKVRKVWASFPGADYGQHEVKIDKLLIAYVKAGGKLESKGN
jgi:muramidase (phage lysozyme)